MLHIICALKHEARSLVDHFQLVHDGGSKEFTTYGNQASGLTLTITGTRIDAAANGTRHTIAWHNAGMQDAWLNIGIAGHATLPLGTPVLANRVTCIANDRNWFPEIEFTHNLDTSALVTVDQPVNDYQRGTMYDLEAAGFFQEASTIGNPDRVHCLKVISDNADHPANDISALLIRELVMQNLPVIDTLVTDLMKLSSSE